MTNENRVCVCCFMAWQFEDEGQLGDICPYCGWEVDQVENCLTEYFDGACGEEDDFTVVDQCLCHLNTPDHLQCGWSSANGDTIRQARQ
jgi:hypothetical protein